MRSEKYQLSDKCHAGRTAAEIAQLAVVDDGLGFSMSIESLLSFMHLRSNKTFGPIRSKVAEQVLTRVREWLWFPVTVRGLPDHRPLTFCL